MTGVCFVDCETTGLDRALLQVWEVALIETNGTEHVWQLPVDLGKADPMSLSMNGFHDRRLPPAGEVRRETTGVAWSATWTDSGREGGDRQSTPATFCREFVRLTRDKHLVGANVGFDERALWSLLRANHECPCWHYRTICVEALAAGKLGQMPVSLSKTAEALGIPTSDAPHSALGDARMAKLVFEKVMG